MTKTTIRRLAVLWIAAIIAGSLMPSRVKIAIGTTTPDSVPTRPAGFGHRAYHVASFGIAALLLLLLATNRRQELYAAASILALGLAIESIQHFVMSGPAFEWWDVREDAVGIGLAWIAVQFKGVREALVAPDE